MNATEANRWASHLQGERDALLEALKHVLRCPACASDDPSVCRDGGADAVELVRDIEGR